MNELAVTLLTLGGLFLVGLLTDLLGRHTFLPRVTLLLLFGVLIGPSGFDRLPDVSEQWFPIITTMALVMVGFLLGGRLTLSSLREHGRVVLWVSVVEVVVTATIVLIGLRVVGISIEVALLLAGIATATAPAATVDVVRELKAKGPFSTTLIGIVAIDDAWGLVAFSMLLAVAQSLTGVDGGGVLLNAAFELGGALLVGLLLGVPAAYLTGRIEPGEPTLAEALGIVLLCGGISLLLDVSFLLASMALGCVVTNLARHHRRPFHAIEGVEWPFMILFFVLAGASLDVASLQGAGVLGCSYVFLRAVGRLVGGWLGAWLSGADRSIRRWVGMALMPQAGVAVGMALIAARRFPDLAELILPVVIGATVVFELVGPVLTRRAILWSGEGESK